MRRLPVFVSTPSKAMAREDLQLLAKLGSFLTHIDELWSYQPPRSETADVLAARQILHDPQVQAWESEMRALGLLPIKRTVPSEDEEDARTIFQETGVYPGRPGLGLAARDDLKRRRKNIGWVEFTPLEIVPRGEGWTLTGPCPLCLGSMGGAHMSGCLIGGAP